jgi:predicted membrane channel-forming protein YqfA (hemolysin III family)
MTVSWSILISLLLWGIAAFAIQQSKTCPCPQVDVKVQNFVELFCYYAIAWTVILGAGELFKSLQLPQWLVGGVGGLYVVGQLIWAIATLYYMEQLKVCACKETYESSITYWFAVSEVVSLLLVVVVLGSLGGAVLDTSSSLSKAIKKGIRKGLK